MTAVQRALARMRQARSVDLPEVIEVLRTSRADTVALVWCLQGLTSKVILDVLKGVAVEWLAKHGDARAIAPLEQLIALPSMLKTSPGMVKEAQKAIRRLSARAT